MNNRFEIQLVFLDGRRKKKKITRSENKNLYIIINITFLILCFSINTIRNSIFNVLLIYLRHSITKRNKTSLRHPKEMK